MNPALPEGWWTREVNRARYALTSDPEETVVRRTPDDDGGQTGFKLVLVLVPFLLLLVLGLIEWWLRARGH